MTSNCVKTQDIVSAQVQQSTFSHIYFFGSTRFCAKAKKKHKINLKKSYIIGDRWRDIEAGKKAKCKTILLDHNYKEKIKIKPDFNVKKIIQVLKVIKN